MSRRSMFDDPFFNDPFFNDPFTSSFPFSRHAHPRASPSSSRVTIEEVDDNDHTPSSPSNAQIVTHSGRNHQRTSHYDDDRMSSYDPLMSSGFGMGSAFGMMHRMERMMNNMSAGFNGFGHDMDMNGGGGSFSSFSSMSYSSSSGSDGKPVFKQQTSTSTNINGVQQSKSYYNDSYGNEKLSLQRGVGKKSREIIKERRAGNNGQMEEKQIENLNHIQPEEVDEFDRNWEERRRAVDPHNRAFNRDFPLTQSKRQHYRITNSTNHVPRLTSSDHHQDETRRHRSTRSTDH